MNTTPSQLIPTIPIWTIQPLAVWKSLQSAGVLHVDLSRCNARSDKYLAAYEWLRLKIADRTLNFNGDYPWWGLAEKPDMREPLFAIREQSCLIQLALPASQVCLTDFDLWGCAVAYGSYVALNEEDHLQWSRLSRISPHLARERVRKSWERIFDLDNTDLDRDFYNSRLIVQASFAPLRYADVISMTPIPWRPEGALK